MKLIVTHLRPDLDAATAAWLIYTHLPGWSNAEFRFIPAGSTLDNLPPDDNSDIIHVDTGLGKFDHHQFQAKLSASKMVFDHLLKMGAIAIKGQEALDRLVNYVTEIDNFAEMYFPNPNSDIYDFLLNELIEGYKAKTFDDEQVIRFAFSGLEAALQMLKNKINAEKEIKNGLIFQSKFGKTLAIETRNEEALTVALKEGYRLVIRKDPEKGFIRLKTPPERKYDLTAIYEIVKKKDPKATWYLHISKNMLLNGSSKNPGAVASRLSLQQLIEIVKTI